MLDVAAELAVRWGDWYTGGMFAVPLALLALAVRVREHRETAIAIGVGAVLLFAVAAPAYGRARDECARLDAAGLARPGHVAIIRGRFHQTPEGLAAQWARSESLRTGCYHLLR